jgi:hypothetical protein
MTGFHFRLSIFLCSLFMLFLGINAEAQNPDPGAATTTTTTTIRSPENGTVTKVVETRRAVVTPVPEAKEVIATPQGYVSCFTVEAGWFNDVWVPTHRVCQYSNAGEGVVWVEGYWACNKATTEGVCTNWEWKAGRWEKSLVVY